MTNRRGVRIRISGDDILSNNSFSDEERQLQQQRGFNNINNNNSSESAQIILDNNISEIPLNSNFNNYIEKKEVNISPAVLKSNGGKKSKSKRKYTLEELEVEGFEPSTSESERQSNIPGKLYWIYKCSSEKNMFNCKGQV